MFFGTWTGVFDFDSEVGKAYSSIRVRCYGVWLIGIEERVGGVNASEERNTIQFS